MCTNLSNFLPVLTNAQMYTYFPFVVLALTRYECNTVRVEDGTLHGVTVTWYEYETTRV